MRAAIIENNSVVNIIECSENELTIFSAIPSSTAKVGDTYINGVFNTPEISLDPNLLKLQKIKCFTILIQRHLDAAAAAKGYDSMLSAVSYAGFPNSFQAEAIILANWRSAVWTKCYELLESNANLTIEEIMVELPNLN